METYIGAKKKKRGIWWWLTSPFRLILFVGNFLNALWRILLVSAVVLLAAYMMSGSARSSINKIVLEGDFHSVTNSVWEFAKGPGSIDVKDKEDFFNRTMTLRAILKMYNEELDRQNDFIQRAEDLIEKSRPGSSIAFDGGTRTYEELAGELSARKYWRGILWKRIRETESLLGRIAEKTGGT